MKKKMKKALSVLLCICMVLTYVPVSVFAAETDEAEIYDVYIGDVPFTSENLVIDSTDIPGISGSATLDVSGSTYTLTLNNFRYNYTNPATDSDNGTAAILINISPYVRPTIKLVLKGDCHITGPDVCNSSGLRVPKNNVTISGDGSLTATHGDPPSTTESHSNSAIYVHRDLTVDSGTFNACFGSVVGSSGGVVVNGTLTMNGGSITATHTDPELYSTISEGVYVGDNLILNAGSIVATSGSVNEYNKGVFVGGDLTVNGGSVTGTSYAIGAANASGYGVDVQGAISVKGSGSVSGYAGPSKFCYGVMGKSISIADNGTLLGSATKAGSVYLIQTAGICLNSSDSIIMTGGRIEAISDAKALMSWEESCAVDTTGFPNAAVWYGSDADNVTVAEARGLDSTVYSNNGYVLIQGCEHSYNENSVCSHCGLEKTYAITVSESENGTVTSDKKFAAKGSSVTLTVTPDKGYLLDTLSVKQGETGVTVTNNAFTMLAGDVTVEATFKLCEHLEYIDGSCSACGNACTHVGGTATCTKLAICEECGMEYGSVDADNHADTTPNDGMCDYCGVVLYSVTISDPADYNGNWSYDQSGFKPYAVPGEDYHLFVQVEDGYYGSVRIYIDGVQTHAFYMANCELTIPADTITGSVYIQVTAEKVDGSDNPCCYCGQPVFTWAEDFSSATATMTCCWCDNTVSGECEITVQNNSTCVDAGVNEYTATVTLPTEGYWLEDAVYTDTRTVPAEINLDNHTNFRVEYDWNPYEDGTCSVYAVLYCADCDAWLDSDNGDAELTGSVEATDCVHPGSKTYSVTLTLNGQEYTGSETFEVKSDNHVGQFENGFCSACGGYQMPELDLGEDPEWEYDDVYLVYNPGQLFWVADYVNNVSNEIKVKLMNDIVIPEGKEWIPIMDFYGTFDGNFKTVSGLYVKSEGDYVGMFGGGYYSYGTIKNLNITNSYFEGSRYVGGIAGYHAGTIENCFVDGTVTVVGDSYVGALVGSFAGYMYNCFAYAPTLVGSYNSSYSTVENSYYLSETDDGNGGKTAEQFASGEVAFLLQSGVAEDGDYDENGEWVSYIPEIWGQTIGTDAYPVLKGQKVYEGYIYCDVLGYTNDADSKVTPHNYIDGVCDVCSHVCTHTTVANGKCDECGLKIYNVSVDYDKMSYGIEIIEGAYALEGKDYTGKLTLSSRYAPSSDFRFIITIGGVPTTNYSLVNGVLTIPAEFITGDIVITCEGELVRIDTEIDCFDYCAGALSPYTVEWAEDYSSATFTYTCAFCDDVLSNSVGTSCEVISQPTCAKDGLTRYGAAYRDITTTKDVSVKMDPVVHTWQDTTGTVTETCTLCGKNQYAIVLGGVRVNDDNAADILGDGTASYDAATNTLTLNGATVDMTETNLAIHENTQQEQKDRIDNGETFEPYFNPLTPALHIAGGELTLMLQGENTLIGLDRILGSDIFEGLIYGVPAISIADGATLTIDGDDNATLELIGQDFGYTANDHIPSSAAVSGDSLIVNGGTITTVSGIRLSGDYTQNGGNVTAGYWEVASFALSDGTVVANGESGIRPQYFDSNAGGIHGIFAAQTITVTGGTMTTNSGAVGHNGDYEGTMRVTGETITTHGLYALGSISILGGTVTSTGCVGGYIIDSVGMLSMGSSDLDGNVQVAAGPEAGAALFAPEWTISEDATFICGSDSSHRYADATCAAPKTCKFCGTTDGEKNPDAHAGPFADGVCDACGEACDHATVTDTVCDICGVQLVAMVGDTYYKTFAEAVAAARALADAGAESAEIIVIADATVSEYDVFYQKITLTVNQGVTLTLDDNLYLYCTLNCLGTMAGDGSLHCDSATSINGGTFYCNVYGSVSGGTFYDAVSGGDISGGMFYDNVYAYNISGGTFHGDVSISGTSGIHKVTGGTFLGNIILDGGSVDISSDVTVSGYVEDYDNAALSFDGVAHTHTPGEVTWVNDPTNVINHKVRTQCTTCPFTFYSVVVEEHSYVDGICVCTRVEAYDVYVDGVRVDYFNAADVLGDGKVSYDATTHTLTLNNVSITNGVVAGDMNIGSAIFANGDLKLVLNGDNTLIGGAGDQMSLGVYVEGTLTISGTGTLTAGCAEAEIAFSLFSMGLTVEEGVNVTCDGIAFIPGTVTAPSGFHAIVAKDMPAYTYEVYGNVTLSEEFDFTTFETNDSINTLTVMEGATLTITDGGKLIANMSDSTITNNGTIVLQGSGTVANNGTGVCLSDGSNHVWVDRVCLVCHTVCEHIMTDATCTAPKTCSICGETEGDALGHDWKDATCTDSKTCGTCGAVEGNPNPDNHTSTDYTYKYRLNRDFNRHEKFHACCGVSVGMENHSYNEQTGLCNECGAEILVIVEMINAPTEYLTHVEYALRRGGRSATLLKDHTNTGSYTVAVDALYFAEGVTLTNNGTLVMPENFDLSTLVNNYNGTGVVTIGDASYVWNGEKFICAGDHTPGDDGFCVLCGERATFDIWVQDIQVTVGNAADVLGDLDEGATVTYDAATNTLYLNNATIGGAAQGIHVNGDLNLHITGNNSITTVEGESATQGIYTNIGALTIDGTGSLHIQSAAAVIASYGIIADFGLHIKGGSVTVIASNASISIGVKTDNIFRIVTVDSGATLTASGDPDGSFFGVGINAKTVSGEGTVNAIALLTQNADEKDFTEHLVIYGNATLKEDSPSVGFYHIIQGAVLTIAEGFTLDMSNVTVNEITLDGTIVNNGTVVLPDSYTYATIPTALTGGTVTIGESSYIWNGEKYVCGNHSDADNSGRCDNCQILMQPAKLVMTSVSLKGNIGVNYYMLLSDEVLADSTAYMQFILADGEIIKIPVSEGVQMVRDGETYYVYSCNVDAKEMTDDIISQFFYDGGVSREHTYNVQTYAKHILENYDDEATKNLITSMLNYGAASQTHFGYNTDNMANAELAAPDYSGVTIEGFNAVAGQGTDLAKLYSASLILKSETTLRFFFKVDSGVENLTVTYNGQGLEVKERSGLYYVDVVGIAAKALDEDVTVIINDGTNTAEVSFNPMAYCQGVLNDTTGAFGQDMKDLVAALYLYNQAANTYFKEV